MSQVVRARTIIYCSFNKLSGNFEPGGKRGLSIVASPGTNGGVDDDFVEFPAFPDLTILRLGPLRGGIEGDGS